MAGEFRDTGVVRPDTLLAATARYLAGTTADVIVADALMPYLPSLYAWVISRRSWPASWTT